jgi:hypothetical protein
VEGCLVSTIVYRKPRKQKALPAGASTQPVLAEFITAPETETVPPELASMDDIDKPACEATPGTDDIVPDGSDVSTVASATERSGPTAVQHQRSQYSMQELRYYEELKEYIQVKAPRVAQMRDPLTLDQAIEIGANYDQDLIFAALEEMQRSTNLITDFSSAHHAFKVFSTGREYKKTRRSRSWSKPRPRATHHY